MKSFLKLHFDFLLICLSLLFPCRSRCCCISCSWRPSRPRTVNDRASSSPLKYRANIDSADLRLWPWRNEKRQPNGSKWAYSSVFFNWLTRFLDCLWLCLPPSNTRGHHWASEARRTLSFISLITWYLVWFLVPSVLMWVHLLSAFLHCSLLVSGPFTVCRQKWFINQEISPYKNEYNVFPDSWISLPTNQNFHVPFVFGRCSLEYVFHHQLNTAKSVLSISNIASRPVEENSNRVLHNLSVLFLRTQEETFVNVQICHNTGFFFLCVRKPTPVR